MASYKRVILKSDNISELTNDAGYITSAGSVAWGDISGKPNVFMHDYVTVSGNPTFAGTTTFTGVAKFKSSGAFSIGSVANEPRIDYVSSRFRTLHSNGSIAPLQAGDLTASSFTTTNALINGTAKVINSTPHLYVGDDDADNSGSWDANIQLDSHANARLRLQQRSDAKNLELFVHGGYEPLIQATDSSTKLRLGVGGQIGLELDKYSVHLNYATYVQSLRANNSSGLITIYNQGYGSKGNLELNNITGAESTFTNRVNTGQVRFTDSSKTSFNHLNVAQWATAYGWGDHSSQGYTKVDGSNHLTIQGHFYDSGNQKVATENHVSANYLTSGTKVAESTKADYVDVYDTRSSIIPPFNGGNHVRFDFKYNTKDGLVDGGTFHTVMNVQQWSDNSGGKSHQLGFTDNNNLWMRVNTNDSSWGTWVKAWTSLHFSSTQITNWHTAYGWGNHADAGYSKFSGSYDDLTNKPSLDGNLVYNQNIQPVSIRQYWADSTPSGVQFNNAFSAPNNTSTRAVYFDGGPGKSSVSTWYGVANKPYSAIDVSQTYLSIWTNNTVGAWNRMLDVFGDHSLVRANVNFQSTGIITASGGDSTGWNQAYGWGNHASAGYWSDSNKPNISEIPNNAGYITNTNTLYSFPYNDYESHWANDTTNSKQNNTAMSIKLWDVYNDASKGSPTDYGTILDVYGRNGHERDQLYFGNLGQIYHRNTFYGNNGWNNWYKIHSTKNLEDSFVTKLRNNSGNWDTAYGWGNHASAQYASISSPSFTGQVTIGSNNRLIGGFGAVTTAGTADWNHSSNAISGNGYTLLLGNATNGHRFDADYYHTMHWEYASNNGNGNMTQLAVPYSSTGAFAFRTRYSGNWSNWRRIIDTGIISTYADKTPSWVPSSDPGYLTSSSAVNNASKVGGYSPITTGRNNTASGLMLTDGSGYANFGWINTTSGEFTGTPNRIYASSDQYMRYMTLENFRARIFDVSGGGDSIGTTDGQNFHIKTNSTYRISIASDGVVTIPGNTTFNSNAYVGGNLATDTITNYRGSQPVSLWTDKVIVGKTGHETTPNKLVLRGHSVPHPSLGYLGGEGWLEFESKVTWTGAQRRWAITNAYDLGGGYAGHSGSLAFLVAEDSGQYPSLRMSGYPDTADGKKTHPAMVLTRDKELHNYNHIILKTNNTKLHGISSGNATVGLIGIRSDNWIELGTSGFNLTSASNLYAPRLVASDNSHTLTMGHWAGSLRIEGSGTEPMQIGTHHSAELRLATHNTTRLTIASDGNSTFSGDAYIHKGVPQLELKDTGNNTRGYIGINNGVLKVGTKDNANLHFQTNGTDRGYFLANGTFVTLGAIYSGSVQPNSSANYDLGSDGGRWRQIHTNSITIDGRSVSGSTIDRIAQGTEANGWGNHASAGYYKNGSAINVSSITHSGSFTELNDLSTHKKLYVAFAHGVANQKADIVIPNTHDAGRFWGEVIVTVNSGYSNENASGSLKVCYALGLNHNGGQYTNASMVMVSEGRTPLNYALDDAFRWDATNNHWYLTIAHLKSTGNQAYIQIEAKAVSPNYLENFQTAYVTSVYTTNTDVFRNRGYEYNNSFNIKAPNLLVGSYLNADKTTNVGSTANGITIAGEHAPTLSLWDTSSAGFHSHLYQVGSDLTLRSSGTWTMQVAGGTRALYLDRYQLDVYNPQQTLHSNNGYATMILNGNTGYGGEISFRTKGTANGGAYGNDGKAYFYSQTNDLYLRRAGVNALTVGAYSSTLVHDLYVQSSGNPRIYAHGSSNGYVNGAFVTSSKDINRGGGLFMYDRANDVEWFAGRPYSNSDAFIIARASGNGSHSGATAQYTNEVFKVTSDSYVHAHVVSTNGIYLRGTNHFPRFYRSGDDAYIGTNTQNTALKVADNGNVTVFGSLTAYQGNSNQWNDAYGWGDHARAGYQTSRSDIRLKTNISTIETPLDKISKLRGVTFDWKEHTTKNTVDTGGGVIAQEVEKVMPEFVHDIGNGSGMKTVDYNGLIGVLIESVKELKEQVNNCNCKCNCKGEKSGK